MMRLVACGLLTLTALPGCWQPAGPIHELHQELAELRSQNARLRQQTQDQQKIIETLERGTKDLLQLADKRLDKLFRASRLEIGRLSGGRNFDGQPGDDGVAVYLQLYDDQDQPFKAAGEIEVQVFDLEGPDGGALIGECPFDIDAARAIWYGQLFTYHYRVDCLWPGRQPRGSEVTVRATFLDYLTGNVLVTTRQLAVQAGDREGSESSRPGDR